MFLYTRKRKLIFSDNVFLRMQDSDVGLQQLYYFNWKEKGAVMGGSCLCLLKKCFC